MKSINRIEENWTPKWELGLQDEFTFGLTLEVSDEPALPRERATAWSTASREVLNRQSPRDEQISDHGSSLREVVSFLENLGAEISGDE